MSPLFPIRPSSLSSPSVDSNLFVLKKNPTLGDFESVIDQMVSHNLSRSTPSTASIAAQQQLSEFKHKLAVLTTLVEQAQIAMNEGRAMGGSPAEQEYYYFKSKLSQVGLPYGNNNLI